MMNWICGCYEHRGQRIGSKGSTVPADKGLNSRTLIEGCNGKTGTSSGIPTHSASITATTGQRTAISNLEQPNYEGKCDNKYDRNLDKLFHFFLLYKNL